MTIATPNPTGREVWLAHVQAWRASGLRKPAYCETQGLKLSTLNYWCRVETAPQPEPTLTLIPISQSSTRRGRILHASDAILPGPLVGSRPHHPLERLHQGAQTQGIPGNQIRHAALAYKDPALLYRRPRLLFSPR